MAAPIKLEHAIMQSISEEEMQEVYNWVDEIPLSRPKKNIARDFSDCVLVAEVIKHFLPNIIDLHNYCNAHSITQKTNNWTTLNNKVLKKFNLILAPKDIKDAVEMVPETIERILFTIRFKIEQYSQRKKQKRLESAQNKRSSSYAPGGIPNGFQMMDNQVGMPMSEIQNTYDNNQYSMNPSHIQMSQPQFQNQNKPDFGGPQGRAYPIQMQQAPLPVQTQYQQYQQNQYVNKPTDPGSLEQILQEKDNTINQLRETVEILELKIKKLEQLVKLKDSKIGNLTNKLSSMGVL